MRKNLFINLIFYISMLTLLTGCNTTQKEPEKIRSFTIATDTMYAPFEYTDSDDKHYGIDIELLNAIANDQGFKYSLQPVGFEKAMEQLENGEVDGVMAGLTVNEYRQEKFNLSDPYFQTGIYCAVLNNSTISSYEGLKGKPVAVRAGSLGEEYAKSISSQYGFTVNPVGDAQTMYAQVKDGTYAALFEEYPRLGFDIKQGQPFKMIGNLQDESPLVLAADKNSEAGKQLVELFNDGLEEVRENGQYDQIINNYIKK